MHAREKGEQRKGKRATKPRTKQGVASSRARDARREGGTAGTGHKAGTTPHRSTEEGSTRGTREKRHHAPRQAPHRHHTHCTHPHPCPEHVASEPGQPGQRAGSRARGSALPQTPLTKADGSPPGDALPPPPRRATPARKGARRGAGAVSPRRHRPHPGHTGRRTPAARPRGRAAGGGTAPDTRRPPQRWQATLPGDGPPPPPRHAAPTGHAGRGDSDGPPHPHTCAHSMCLADPNSAPSGRVVRRGGAPDPRRPSQRWKAPPPGMPFHHPHSEQRRPARAHAVGPVLSPHARTDSTRDTRVAEPRLPAPEDGRLGEGQRLTPDAPHNGGGPPPPGTAPRAPPPDAAPIGHAGQGDSDGPPHPHARARSTRVTDPNSSPSGGAVGGGGAPDLRHPS